MSLLLSIPFLKSRASEPRQVISPSWADRDKILDDLVNMFCWERPVDEMISDYLESLLDKDLEPIRFSTNLESMKYDLEQARSGWEHERTKESDLFWRDVSSLVRDFLVYSTNKSGMVYLKVITDNACAQFHTDCYHLRLFTTYYGKGTEWLPESATNRKGLGGSNKSIVRDASQIQQLKPFEVGILKGEIPGAHATVKGIVHRSPEITDEGGKRIILRIDI